VEDDGPGIPATSREIVLGPPGATRRGAQISGLRPGASLVAAVTKLHGARLVLDDAGRA